MKVSMEQYLGTTYKPSCDYIDGTLRPKAWAAYAHSRAQFEVCAVLQRWSDYTAVPELTCILRERLCLVPDVAAMRIDDIPSEGQIAAGPIILETQEIFA